ncbi:S-adenosyl-L-methionine-dependent methyltransferase [Phytophthora cactorum]|nr:S-adenosyl-L-methionine-dependent methyltransferase [Phytophthora cactorum]
MVLLCSTPPAPLPVDVAATSSLVQEVTTSAAAREHVRALAGTTYGRCVLGLAGFLTIATEYLAAFVKRMYGDVSEDELKTVHEILLLLAETVVDEDNATFIARIGAHPLLMRLMEHDDEDIQEAAAEVVSACTSSPSAITFPHRVRQVGEVERLWPRAVPLPFDPRDNVPKNADGSQSTLNVLIRQVPSRMTGQRKTGYLLWGAAFVLARWIHKHRDLFVSKSVLEVGSGLGLGGITAARYANNTTLTDYQSDTCTALEYNVQLNKPFTHEFDPSKPEVTFRVWTGTSPRALRLCPRRRFPVQLKDSCALSPSRTEQPQCCGLSYECQQPQSLRCYPPPCASGCEYRSLLHHHTVGELPDGAELLETVSDAEELSYEFYEIRAAST